MIVMGRHRGQISGGSIGDKYLIITGGRGRIHRKFALIFVQIFSQIFAQVFFPQKFAQIFAKRFAQKFLGPLFFANNWAKNC